MRIHCLTAVFAILSACGHASDKPVGRDSKLQQTPQINEVEVITLEKTSFARQILSNGKLSAAFRARLSFGSGGPLAAVNVRNGQTVDAGTILAAVDRPDLRLALESAQIALEKAEFDLYDYLAGQGYAVKDTASVPADILAMAKMKSGYTSARNSLARARCDMSGTVLEAPFRGRIADIRLSLYDQTGTEPFCTLMDDSSFHVDFTVMESEYSFLSTGLSVKVMPYADGTLAYRGTIADINPVVDKNGQVSVRACIRNDGHLIDGMNVKVTVEQMISGQFVVPRSAVVVRDNLDVLFTYTDDGTAHWTYVNILMSNGDSHAVIANADRGAKLNSGDRVIISGNLNLADGSSAVLKK